MRNPLLSCALTIALFTVPTFAQGEPAGVPSQVRFSGALTTKAGAPRAGTAAVVFSLYQQQKGGAPLWVETQNVQLDAQGRYAVTLGAVNALPNDIFAANEARWLGVQVLADAEPEQARVMLVSVPYALKAQDAETLGGRPASAYLLAESVGALPGNGKGGKPTDSQAAATYEMDGNVQTVTAHTVNAIPKFTATDTLGDSLMFETYNQLAFDAYGLPLIGNEDVVNIGDGSGLRKRLNVVGRVTAQAFDINSSALPNSFRVVNDHPDALAMQANARDGGNGFATGLFASALSNNAAAITAFVFEPDVPNVGDEYSVGMFAGNYNPAGPAAMAWSAYDGTAGGDDFPIVTAPVGLYASAAHTTGIAAVLDYRHTGTAKLLSARNNGTEVASMNSAGNIITNGSITAASFSGDGSALTNVTGVGSLASDPAACSTNNFVTDIAADGTLTCDQPSVSDLSDGGTLATTTYVDAADTALAAPQYVTLATTGTLANERVLTAGKGIAITDGGAGSAVTIDNKAEFAQATTSDTLTAAGDFATAYPMPANTLTAGMVIEVWAAGTQTTDSSGTGNSFTYGVKLGSTTVIPAGGQFMRKDFLNAAWTFSARIVVVSVVGSVATLESYGLTTMHENCAALCFKPFITTSNVTVDPTTSLNLTVFEGATLIGDSTTMRQLIVKILK